MYIILASNGCSRGLLLCIQLILSSQFVKIKCQNSIYLSAGTLTYLSWLRSITTSHLHIIITLEMFILIKTNVPLEPLDAVEYGGLLDEHLA